MKAPRDSGKKRFPVSSIRNTFFFSLSLYLFFVPFFQYSSICTRNAKSRMRRTRETRARDTRPFAGESLRKNDRSSLSLYSFSRTLVYSPSLSTRFPHFLSLSFSFFVRQVFLPCRALSPFRSSPFQPFLPPFLSVNLSFFSFSRHNERVPRNRSTCFKTSTSRCSRKVRTEEERAADASNGLQVRVRPFTNSTADPRTHTHARAS